MGAACRNDDAMGEIGRAGTANSRGLSRGVPCGDIRRMASGIAGITGIAGTRAELMADECGDSDCETVFGEVGPCDLKPDMDMRRTNPGIAGAAGRTLRDVVESPLLLASDTANDELGGGADCKPSASASSRKPLSNGRAPPWPPRGVLVALGDGDVVMVGTLGESCVSAAGVGRRDMESPPLSVGSSVTTLADGCNEPGDSSGDLTRGRLRACCSCCLGGELLLPVRGPGERARLPVAGPVGMELPGEAGRPAEAGLNAGSLPSATKVLRRCILFFF